MTDNPAVTIPMTHTEHELAQAEADDWQSDFLDALHRMNKAARNEREAR